MLEVSFSKERLDPEWDRFLENMPHSCYQQGSLWAKLRAVQGWRPLRLVVRRHGQIVGGVQMLLRPLPLFGTVGFVSKGPIVAPDDPAVQEFVLDQLDRVARAEHIFFLKIQLPHGADGLGRRLLERDAQPSEIPVTPRATACFDIRPEPEAILARMHHKTRYNIRRADRVGVAIRRGTEADIPTLYRLAKIHAKLRGYGSSGVEKSYYDLWSVLSSSDHICLFMAEYKGDVFAANASVLFGDTVTNRWLVDDGRYRNLNAHSRLHWEVVLWGKERGCAWYNLGKIAMPVARALMEGEPPPDTGRGWQARFKMSFGSRLMVSPGVYDVSYLRPRRLTGRLIPLLINMGPLLRLLIGGRLGGHVRRRHRETQDVTMDLEQRPQSSGTR